MGIPKTSFLAKRIIRPKNNEEKRRDMAIAFENIELFKRIHERLGEKIPTEGFWVDLVEITGAERSMAQKEAIKIRNIYIDGNKYPISMKPGIEIITAPPSDFELLESSDFSVKVRRDIASINFLEAQFKPWLDHLKRKLSAGPKK